jgi:tetratricopeptide (TPR) repeat protein
VVYGSILDKRKKRLHEEIGSAIEELYKDSLSEHYEVLAEHYFLSENYSKSGEFSRLASRKAEKAASFHDAIAFTKKRVTSLERLPQKDEVQKQIIDARGVLGLYLAERNYFPEAKEAIDPIIDLAIKYDYKRRLCQIYSILGAYYSFVEDNYPESFKALEEALKISEQVKDTVTSALASFWFGVALGWNCEFERAALYVQRALDINVAAKSLWGIAAIKGNLAYSCYYFQGKIDLAFQTTSEALRIAEESGDSFSKGIAYGSHGVSCYGKGLLGEAEKNLIKGVEYLGKTNEGAWNANARFHLGETYFEMGNLSRSKEHYEEGCWLLEHHRLLPSWMGLGKVGLARSKVMNKEKDVNLEALYAHSRNNKVKNAEGWIQRYIGEILLNIDDQHLSESEHWIQKAIEADQRNGTMFDLGKDYALYAELFKQRGDKLKAQENLGKAIEIFKECGADGWVEKAEKELATIL